MSERILLPSQLFAEPCQVEVRIRELGIERDRLPNLQGGFSRTLTVCAELPEITTIARPIAARASRVYVDYLQNGRGKLIVAPFSVRPRPKAPASAPLRWSQLTTRLDPTRFTIKTLPRLMAKSGDPGRPLLGPGIDVEALLTGLTERLARSRSS